jgi:hypothetical protein
VDLHSTLPRVCPLQRPRFLSQVLSSPALLLQEYVRCSETVCPWVAATSRNDENRRCVFCLSKSLLWLEIFFG